MHYRENYAVSEILGIILILIISTTAISFITLWSVPYISQKQAEGRAQSALIQFNAINDIIKNDVNKESFILGTEGPTSIVSFTTNGGEVTLNQKSERFVFYYSLKEGTDFDVFNLGDSNDREFHMDNPGGQVRSLRIYYLYKPGGAGTNTELISPVPMYPNPITTSEGDLKDAVKINVYDVPIPLPLTRPIGQIWLFDTGSISYTTQSSSDTFKLIAENTGIIYGRNSNYYLDSEPNIIKDDANHKLMMNIVRYTSDEISGSGGGKYQFTIKLTDYEALTDVSGVAIPEYFRTQVFGDGTKAWRDYFKISQGFSDMIDILSFPSVDNTIELEGRWTFTLTQSVCDVDMKVLG